MLNRFREFMYGRYGADRLNWFLLITYSVWSMIFSRTILAYGAFIFLGLFFYRFFSKDVYKRSGENIIFSQKTEPIVAWSKKKYSQLNDREHRYYSCPNCKKVLRVPRGRGKIEITCPSCKTKITKKT